MTVDDGEPKLTFRRLVESIPPEHWDRVVLVSFDSGYCLEGPTGEWRVRDDGVLLLESTGDREGKAR